MMVSFRGLLSRLPVARLPGLCMSYNQCRFKSVSVENAVSFWLGIFVFPRVLQIFHHRATCFLVFEGLNQHSNKFHAPRLQSSEGCGGLTLQTGRL